MHIAKRQILNLREILVEWIIHLTGSDGTPARESSLKPLGCGLGVCHCTVVLWFPLRPCFGDYI